MKIASMMIINIIHCDTELSIFAEIKKLSFVARCSRWELREQKMILWLFIGLININDLNFSEFIASIEQNP